jgi:hypothetical protein
MYLGKRTRKIIFRLKKNIYRGVIPSDQKENKLRVPPHLMFYRKVCFRLTHRHTYILCKYVCTCYAQSFYWLPTSQKSIKN